MKNTDPICPILVLPLTLFYTFLCQTSVVLITASTKPVIAITYSKKVKLNLAALAQMVACLPLVQKVRGSIPGGVVNFNLKKNFQPRG